MAVESDADRLSLLADFGDTVSGPTGVDDFTSIVDQREDDETFDDLSKVWIFRCRTSDVESVNEGDLLTVGSDQFRVARKRQDQDGMRDLVCVAK